ncbi:ferritin [Nocardia bhagyanarayanae]|uniref:Ferritin n=1 Tax=Nocardia bhagyanarayanae TaxID=1215925 RepID=A0A543F6P7_9NOCA|nr:ferritin-like domain-containing protein [Nocardia bhagyanarayanae]TQM29508.1 ferritin [Nocardia bhagyanarayanae]
MSDTDGAPPFPALLRDQIRHGFTVAQQYLAGAVYFDAHRLPQLARHCYARSEEHRGHALRMVQHLLDRDLEIRVGGLDSIRSDFESPRAAIAFLLEAERGCTAQVTALAKAARDSGDYLGERFTQWFLKAQLDNVARMTTLLTVLDREGNLFDVEQFVAREVRAPAKADISAPKMAGAANI